MSPRRIAWWVVTTLGAAAVLTLFIVDPSADFPFSILGVSALVVGAVLAHKVPTNPIGWLLLGLGTAGGVGVAMEILLGQSQWADVANNTVATAAVPALIAVMIRFPTGSPSGKLLRWLDRAVWATAVIGGAAALLIGGWGGNLGAARSRSPLYESTEPLGDILSGIFLPLYILVFALGAVAVIVRFRQSSGVERLQFKWLAYGSGLILLALAAMLTEFLVSGAESPGLVPLLMLAIATSSIPVAIGIAVLRYRLYDVDLVISRTVTLAILVTFITLVYALVVVGVGRLVGAESDGLTLPIAATALVAIAFEPVRVRAQRWANRLVYGSRATPYEVLREITGSMGQSGPGGDILARLAELLRDGTGAERTSVWLGAEGEMTPAASSPADAEPGASPSLEAPNVFPVVHDNEVVGALEVVKERGSTMSSSETSLASDLAGSAGAVLGYQRLNQSLQRRATELEQSRSRLLDIQGNERRRLEQDLHEGAEQFIVALKVKLGVAARLADRHGADQLKAMLDGLTDEAQAALDDVQSLAKGIYPSVLQTDGLASAISSLAASTPVEVEFQRDGVRRYPTDLEAAVYFGISEAVTNAVKHATPPIMIKMEERDGVLHFSVIDQGPGFEVDEANMGSGLENMADRLESVGGSLEVISSSGDRTEIRGMVPY